MRDRKDLAESARHEAGHAIARIVLVTGPIYRIVVLRELDSQGCGGFIEAKPNVFVRNRPDPQEFPEPSPDALEAGRKPEYRSTIRRYLWKQAIETYAGVAAQNLRSGGDWFSHELVQSSRTDRRILVGHYAMFGWELEDRMDGAALRAARRFIDPHYGALMAMEAALLARFDESDGDAELFGGDLRAIFASAPRMRNPWREREWTKAEMAAVREEGERWYKALVRERNAEGSVHLDPEPAAGCLSPTAPLAPFAFPLVGGIPAGWCGR